MLSCHSYSWINHLYMLMSTQIGCEFSSLAWCFPMGAGDGMPLLKSLEKDGNFSPSRMRIWKKELKTNQTDLEHNCTLMNSKLSRSLWEFGFRAADCVPVGLFMARIRNGLHQKASWSPENCLGFILALHRFYLVATDLPSGHQT